jgi:hypothetical protein
MNKFFRLLAIPVVALAFFTSCDLINGDDFPSDQVKGAYVINYGTFGGDPGSISKFNDETNVLTNNYFSSQNDGLELVSNIQYAYTYKDSIYLIGNVKDQLITVNPLFQQTRNGVSEGLANPRYCVASGDYLYISCWGAAPDYTLMADSYIAKFNLKTNKVDGKINVPGGTEGLAISRGKLYVALNYVDSIAVINLKSDDLTYIATPAVSSYFVEDGNKNLYVSLVSTWSDFSTETGLGYINTSDDKLEKVYKLDGVSSDYGSIVASNTDQSKIYLLTAQYDENWNLTGAVSAFDVATGTFSTFINGILGPKGISVNPSNDQVYLFKAESAVEGGSMAIYQPNGTLVNEYAVGISPYMALFIE